MLSNVVRTLLRMPRTSWMSWRMPCRRPRRTWPACCATTRNWWTPSWPWMWRLPPIGPSWKERKAGEEGTLGSWPLPICFLPWTLVAVEDAIMWLQLVLGMGKGKADSTGGRAWFHFGSQSPKLFFLKAVASLWTLWERAIYSSPECVCVGHSVMSNSLQPHGLGPTRLLGPWDFLGKSIEVGCHFLLQGIFLTQVSNLHLPLFRQTLYCLSHTWAGSNVIWPKANVFGCGGHIYLV